MRVNAGMVGGGVVPEDAEDPVPCDNGEVTVVCVSVPSSCATFFCSTFSVSSCVWRLVMRASNSLICLRMSVVPETVKMGVVVATVVVLCARASGGRNKARKKKVARDFFMVNDKNENNEIYTLYH